MTRSREEYNAYYREYNKKNPDARRKYDFKRKFGITLEQYNEMLVAQNACCAICKRPESALDHRTKQIRNLAVDHCHKTGEIRGLLCSKCNTAIGLLEDNKDTLQNAIIYLTGV